MKQKAFAKNLKQVLDSLDMSQIEFARRTGLTAAAISQIVNGEREPSLSTIIKILEVLPIKFERLVK